MIREKRTIKDDGAGHNHAQLGSRLVRFFSGPGTNPDPNRNVQLDFLRGVAIFLVIGHHQDLLLPRAGVVGRLAWYWHDHGTFGVPLFFMLSGFLVSGLLLKEAQRHNRISISRFLIRRGLKIYPGYYFFLFYLFAVPTLREVLAHKDLLRFSGSWLSAFWPNLLFIQNYVGSGPAGHTWTLAIEEHFYIALPFLIAALLSVRRLRLLIPLGLLSPLFFTVIRAISAALKDPYIINLNTTMAATHLTLDGLLFGAGLRALAAFEPERFRKLRRYRPLYLAFAALLFLVPVNAPLGGINVGRMLPVQVLESAAIFLCVYQTKATDFGPFSTWVRNLAKPVARIGAYSYSIYLWHVTVLGICEKFIARFRVPLNSLTWLVEISLTVACVLIVGVLASHLIEWPIVHLRDRLFPSRAAV